MESGKLTSSPLAATLALVALGGVCSPAEAWQSLGRMTGGGWLTCDGVKVTHGFELYCDRNDGTIPVPNNIEINWGIGNRFHLTQLTSVDCQDIQPGAPENPPPGNAAAGFDTIVGKGTGTGAYNNQADSFTINFRLTDLGEPGVGNDQMAFTISNSSGIVISCPLTALGGGDHQAHRATGGKWDNGDGTNGQ